MANLDEQLIDSVTAGKLGQSPQPEAPAEAMANAAPAPAPAAPDPTPQEVASEQGAPVTEADKQSADPVTYEVAFGENDMRQLTGDQIKGTFERYAKLNHDHATKVAPMAPVLKFVEEIQVNAKKNGKDVSPAEITDFFNAAAQAFVKNPTMGGDKSPNPTDGTEREDIKIDTSEMEKWEADNGVSLPPGYKGAASRMEKLEAQNNALMQRLDQIIAGQSGVTDAAAMQVANAQQQQAANMQQVVANNLDAAQAQLGIPDDQADAFFAFAFERGYTSEDFINRELTQAVMSDYKNTVDAPELSRLMQVAQRRQAFTGNSGGSPAAGGAAPQADPDQQYLDGLTKMAMDQRFPTA